MLLADHQIPSEDIEIAVDDILFGQADVFKTPYLDRLLSIVLGNILLRSIARASGDPYQPTSKATTIIKTTNELDLLPAVFISVLLSPSCSTSASSGSGFIRTSGCCPPLDLAVTIAGISGVGQPSFPFQHLDQRYAHRARRRLDLQAGRDGRRDIVGRDGPRDALGRCALTREEDGDIGVIRPGRAMDSGHLRGRVHLVGEVPKPDSSIEI
jgi:hypothetical protein